MTLTREGFLHERADAGNPWSPSAPRYLTYTNAPPDYQSLVADFQQISNLGFTGVILPTSPLVTGTSTTDQFGSQVFPTKRDLMRIMDEANEFGLRVIPRVPAWPTTNTRWSLHQGLVRDWV
ncbi:MAG: hypothetical protein CME06_03155, partial [Gemmatimonadetes bacterium]|nr:hypothetical protein [Gemmatimonadota bacterium]